MIIGDYYLIKTSETNWKIEGPENSRCLISWDYKWMDERIKTMEIGEKIKL